MISVPVGAYKLSSAMAAHDCPPFREPQETPECNPFNQVLSVSQVSVLVGIVMTIHYIYRTLQLLKSFTVSHTQFPTASHHKVPFLAMMGLITLF